MIRSGRAGQPDAGPDGSALRHHPPQAADDSAGAADAGDRGEADISDAFGDADAAWRQIRSVSARLELLRGFAQVLQEHSGELADRSRALQARSAALQSRATALKAENAAEFIQDRSAPGVSLAPVATAPHPPVNFAPQISPTYTAEGPAIFTPDAQATFTPKVPAPFGPYVSAEPQTAEIPLLGGDVTEGVVRVGRTVRRPVRPHTPAVHALLRHLEGAGFDGAPRVLGIDAKNREVLTYLPGVVTRRLLPRFITAESTLVSLAELQFRYHQAAAGFDPPSEAQWDGELTRFVDGPPDVICHCDVNLENVIFRPGPDGPQPYAFIDFDLARPGTRLVDVIQTLRYWAPIVDPADRGPALRNADAPARIAIFCEAYGLSSAERARLVPVASRWLCRSRATIAERARTRGGAWARMLAAGVGDRLLRSAVWLERNRPEIEARLRRPGRLAGVNAAPPGPPSAAQAALPRINRNRHPVTPGSRATPRRLRLWSVAVTCKGQAPDGARDWALAAGVAAGVALDALTGDPRRAHPVAAFGRAAAGLEACMYADDRLRGSLYAGACVLGATLPAVAAHRLTRGRPLLRAAAVAATVWAVTGARSLRHEAERAAVALDTNDLAAAREVLPGLCSRDPAHLGPKDVARAVVESVAENTSDAAVAPLVWAAVAGWPGLAAYRAVNTLDAMVGYRSPRYERFGWAAARLDDVANWAPARLTAALAAACAPAVGGSPRASLRAVCRDGAHHPSPNAGRPEAAFAGALGLRLGGASSYHGVTEYRPRLGDGRAPEPRDIRRAARLSRAVTVSAAVLAVLAALAPSLPGRARPGPASAPGLPGRGLRPVGRPWRSPGRTRGSAR